MAHVRLLAARAAVLLATLALLVSCAPAATAPVAASIATVSPVDKAVGTGNPDSSLAEGLLPGQLDPTPSTPSDTRPSGEPTAAQVLLDTAVPATPTTTAILTPTADMRIDPRKWRNWPAIPSVSARAIEIYRDGLARGNDVHTFSIIGDCQSEPPVYMGRYDLGRYSFENEDAYLQETVVWFGGNFGRQHITVKNGLSVSSAFSPLWADPELCQEGESPLDCEFRLHRPSIVLINLGTNWKNGDGIAHGLRLRELVEAVIARGALPVLSTKADNHENDHSINLSTAQVAYEFDLPLWNFWAAVQYLPNHGIDLERSDLNYLTVEAWSVRGYSGLRALDHVWRVVSGIQPAGSG